MSNSIKVNVAGLSPAQVVAAVAAVTPRIEYDAKWENGTGYFDALAEVKFEGTAVRNFIDPSNRIGIILPTDAGNLVIFQRFSDGQGGIVVSNCSTKLRGLCEMLGFGSSVQKSAIWRVLPWLGNEEGDMWQFHVTTSKLADVVAAIK